MKTSASILIVEDDPALLRGLKDNFEARGFDVRTAINGEIGLQKALDGGPDLILLDVMLPKINGFEICRAVRQEKLLMPIILLTAKGQEEDIIRGLGVGADDYITKPFRIGELMARVQAFLRRHHGSEEEFCFGEFRLDVSAHKLFLGTEEVPLTGKEFGVLKFFLQNIGRALTREAIMNAVWGNSMMVTGRSVDRCMTTLRAKLQPRSGGADFIKTIRDIGYRFELPSREERSRETHL